MEPVLRLPFRLVVPLVLLVVAAARAEIVQEVADARHLCQLCKCSGGGSGRNHIVCRDLPDSKLIFRHVPTDTKLLEVRNVSQVMFASGAVKLGGLGRLEIRVAEVNLASFQSTALSLLTPHTQMFLIVDGVMDKLEFDSHCVHGKGGRFRLQVTRATQIFVAGEAFDVLTKIDMENSSELTLSPTAFKPSVLSEQPDSEIALRNISSISSLVRSTFSSARSIEIVGCSIREISENAFSGRHMESVVFDHCSVDRVQQGAFPPFTLVVNLTFNACNLTSVSEGAVQSAISTLLLKDTYIASMSKGGFDCQVAKVTLEANVFKTLVNQALSLRSWNDFRMTGNTIQFMDFGALSGISNPGQDVNVTFELADNKVVYANRHAMKLNLPEDTIAKISGNIFQRECDCELGTWFDFLCGSTADEENGKKDGSFKPSSLLMNTSLCMAPQFLLKCFGGQSFVPVQSYVEKLCKGSRVDDDLYGGGDACGGSAVWSIITEQLEMTTNKGILLTILLFAVAFSLLVSIYTLFRWIVYTIQTRTVSKKEDEWNFTKVEERQLQTPSPIDHYERLPLTKDTSSIASSNALQSRTETPNERTSGCPESGGDVELVNLEAKEPPKMTFYDEMIDLLKEKLDDPTNYATVADTRNACLYQDPFDIEPKNANP